MPISFIAVQCFDCSTMQVKQQKKSSNKWICVVCNQKQSVRKVFAQSFMAKDVRKFVQNFNMSRQLSDQKQSTSVEEPETLDSPKNGDQKRKRNDWTEYIEEDREESSSKFERGRNSTQGDDGIEPMIVTEIPEAMFRKPKVRDYSCRTEKKLLKPSFPNRREARSSQDSERGSNRDCFTKEAKIDNSKWSTFMAQIRETTMEKPVQQNIAAAAAAASKKKASKWSSFITEEEEDDDNDRNSEIEEKREDYLPMNEQERVEEDIHPDFL